MSKDSPKLYKYLQGYISTGYLRLLKIPELRLLFVILAHHNINNGAFMNYKTINRATKLSGQTIKMASDRLVGLGIITVEKQTISRKGYGYTRNVYRLVNPDDLPCIRG